MEVTVLGAAGEVTGSCFLISSGKHRILLDYGQIQGNRQDEARNRLPLPVPASSLDAVVLSHAHIDHSGRLPLLAREGFTGPVYTHHATRALCEIMLKDSGYLHEKDAEIENRKRARKGLPPVEPLFTLTDAEKILPFFKGMHYGERTEILPNVFVRLSDAGHILGAAIVEIWCGEGKRPPKLVFSGDLGYGEAPIMEDPATIEQADLVLLESTYGDRRHRTFDATLEELGNVFRQASKSKKPRGNILIPAFAVGRSQDLLYLMEQHFDDWQLDRWQVFLDSPMAIEATEVYARHRYLYGAELFNAESRQPRLPNLAMTRSPAESMQINSIRDGAIIIAGSGMCTGGRIRHHLKYNIWRPECHVVIVGFQAYGTLGRRIVEGARHIRLWGETMQVNATVHTIGGLSAHADQAGLLEWYGHFRPHPKVCLVHGEPRAQLELRKALHGHFGIDAEIAELGAQIPVR